MELTNSTGKLLKLLIIVIGLFCTIVVFGVITREPSAMSQFSVDFLDGVHTIAKVDAESLWGIRFPLTRTQLQILKEKICILQEENERLQKELTIANLTPVERYVNYAFEIQGDYYPNIKAEYVCAIMYHESRFDPTVTNSKTGERGLCQINPRWHTKRANALGVTDLYDPYGNILVCFDILNEIAQGKDLSYALNFYAGGYPYANRYSKTESPFELELKQIMDEQNFVQYVLPYDIR